jgi:uncharacterized protein with NAD-binding domain and iron-sulfur cluster
MRITILGGGAGAMTAAYWLAPHHDVTVYQLGWRLGGKGASGRNPDAGYRIEEHGLHIWMGFYANAFRMMRAVYGELNRDPHQPLATWQDAFKPQTIFTMMEKGADGAWLDEEWIIPTPIKPGEPGDQTGFGSPCGYHRSLLEWTKDRIEGFLSGRERPTKQPHNLPEQHVLHLKALHAALHEATAHAGPLREPGKPDPEGITHHHTLLRLALEAVQVLIGVGFDLSRNHLGMQRTLMLVDISVATLLGMIRDLCGNDWTSIDDQEWRAWMLKNGLHQQSSWCSVVRAMYDIVFAYRDGDATDPSKADLAAGTTTCAMMRIYLDYYDSVFLKMQAGMGDTIFAPIYQVLSKRGVKFKYFHRLREVVPSADGQQIDELRIGIQATAKGSYEPLVDVKGLPSWPSVPLYDQLVEGDELREKHIDLEAYDADWPDVAELVLKHGVDFDHVVFGLSLGAVPFVCPQILQQKESWRSMVEHVKVVRTQAAQLWLSRCVADMGWPPALDGRCYSERTVFGTFIEPIDTWADMSQLIPREDWSVPVNNIAYLCGAMKDSDPASEEVPRELTREMLEKDMSIVWTTSYRDGKFRYDWLAVDEPGATFTDEERFRKQFFRVNTQPTELYVLSVSGSTKYRLDPANPGYANLSLAGDWVLNGFALGCVESAVLGGMKGVQRFCPGMVIVE